MSAAGEVEFLNRQVLEYFGKRAEELKGWAISDAIHPDDLRRVIDVFTNSVAAGRPYDIENRYRRTDGVYRWFEFELFLRATQPVASSAGIACKSI